MGMHRINTTNRKLVPQRGWNVVNRCALATVTGWPDSKLKTTLCSAPWYSNTRRMSFQSEMANMNARKMAMRIKPSAMLNGTRPDSTGNSFCSLVTNKRGTNLYMKMNMPKVK